MTLRRLVTPKASWNADLLLKPWLQRCWPSFIHSIKQAGPQEPFLSDWRAPHFREGNDPAQGSRWAAVKAQSIFKGDFLSNLALVQLMTLARVPCKRIIADRCRHRTTSYISAPRMTLHVQVMWLDGRQCRAVIVCSSFTTQPLHWSAHFIQTTNQISSAFVRKNKN